MGICLKKTAWVNKHLHLHPVLRFMSFLEQGNAIIHISHRTEAKRKRYPVSSDISKFGRVFKRTNVKKTSETTDDRPKGLTSKCVSHWTTLLHPCLTHVAMESWSSKFPDMRLKDRKLAKVRIVLFFLKRNIYSNKEPLCWWSKYANAAFCCIQPKSSFQRDLSRFPKREQSQMHSKTVYCAPM